MGNSNSLHRWRNIAISATTSLTRSVPGAPSLRVLGASVGFRSPKNQGSRVIMSTPKIAHSTSQKIERLCLLTGEKSLVTFLFLNRPSVRSAHYHALHDEH